MFTRASRRPTLICCAKLGEHSSGDDRQAAVALLGKADNASAKHPETLLDMKTRSGYCPALTSRTDQTRAGHAAAALLRAAEAI